MLIDFVRPWSLRLVTFAAWLLAAACAAYWGLAVSGGGSGRPVAPVGWSGAPQADAGAIARLLGAQAAVAAPAPVVNASSRFSLAGVIADQARGVAALIAVDGKPPKPYRIGAQVDTGLVLQSVGRRGATLAPSLDGPAAVTLELPLPKKS